MEDSTSVTNERTDFVATEGAGTGGAHNRTGRIPSTPMAGVQVCMHRVRLYNAYQKAVVL